MKQTLLLVTMALPCGGVASDTTIDDAAAQSPVVEPATGLLFFAFYAYRDNTEAIRNPHIAGALLTVVWTMVEPERGKFDWSDVDRRIQPWVDGRKKVALRILWSASGTWQNPYAKHPTPQWVWDDGAKMAYSRRTRTEVPLGWDLTYKKHAFRFMEAMAQKYDGNPNVLFIDISPGGETNPYRGNLHRADPDFRDVFLNTPASDGRCYSEELWLQTVKEYVDAAGVAFKKTPLLVTLNAGKVPGTRGPENFVEVGSYCVNRGLLVGQNGLNRNSYLADSPRRRAFRQWQPHTRFYFEMVAPTGPRTGTLMDVMQAAERIGCSYLGVSAPDALKGTQDTASHDLEYEKALEYGASVLEKTPFLPRGK